MLTVVFWLSLLLIVYVYVGYPILIYLCSRKRASHEPARETVVGELPSITVIIPAYNEERWIRRKIENTLAIDYPRERMQILVASDGSTDRTVAIALEFEQRGVEVVRFEERLGKQEVLNRVVPRAKGDVLVLTDANAILQPDALRCLVRHFADPSVGCVTGRRLCILQAGVAPGLGESLYWRYESWIKQAESRIHSCLGAHGQIYAVRKTLFPHVERVGEDFYIPMKLIAQTGHRVLYEPGAIAYIPAAASLAAEFERKTRAHVSFLLTLPLLKELLLPWRSRVWWQYASHHLLRMFVPLAMVGLFVFSFLLAVPGSLYRFALLAQLGFYTLAAIGFVLAQWDLRLKIFYLPFYFLFANLAVARSWLRWPLRRYDYAWERTERLPTSG